jgi:thiol:disulfide interchange protein DsbD
MLRSLRLTARQWLWTCPFCIFSLFAVQPLVLAATAQVEVVQSQDRYPVGGAYPILFRITIAEHWYLHGAKESGNGLIPTVLSFQQGQEIRIEKIRFPEPQRKKFDYTKEPVEVFSGQILVRATLVVADTAPEGEKIVMGRFSYQACSAESCRPPEKVQMGFTIHVVPQGTPIEKLNRVLFGPAEGPSLSQNVSGWKIGTGFWLTLIAIFFGGMALNLTPCVYPLIPITVSYFGGRSRNVSGRSLAHGLIYIAGLAVTNSALGVTAALTGSLLGAALQNPLILILVSGILVALGLSFFGIWELRIPSGLTQVASKNFGGFFGTFFMGLTLGVVAAPCLGPFILGLLTYVGQQGDPFLGFLYFFVLSIGLGIPLAALAVFSGAIDRLPMSGEWMAWIRKCLGWVLMGMAGYILQPLIPDILGKALLMASILLAAGLHLGWLDRSRAKSKTFSYVKKGLGLALTATAIIFFFASVKTSEGVHWTAYDEGLLADAVKEDKPVILDFYADWCIPCKELDARVFSAADVVNLSRKFVMLRADLTKYNPHQKSLQRRFNIKGVPTVIFIDRGGKEDRSLRVESFVDKEEFLERMNAAMKE